MFGGPGYRVGDDLVVVEVNHGRKAELSAAHLEFGDVGHRLGHRVFRTDRGSEFDNAEIGLVLEAFSIERSLSAKGCPYDNAVDESTNRILKAELVHREAFGTTRELRAKLSDCAHWYNNFRIHSAMDCMSPVEFRKAGLSLPESSK